ncbi:MAG: hypothetical protein IT305_13620 [Chloroflexi bacterium]|nr:hypothetical protein [Chloroflexota bacterium]
MTSLPAGDRPGANAACRTDLEDMRSFSGAPKAPDGVYSAYDGGEYDGSTYDRRAGRGTGMNGSRTITGLTLVAAGGLLVLDWLGVAWASYLVLGLWPLFMLFAGIGLVLVLTEHRALVGSTVVLVLTLLVIAVRLGFVPETAFTVLGPVALLGLGIVILIEQGHRNGLSGPDGRVERPSFESTHVAAGQTEHTPGAVRAPRVVGRPGDGHRVEPAVVHRPERPRPDPDRLDSDGSKPDRPGPDRLAHADSRSAQAIRRR